MRSISPENASDHAQRLTLICVQNADDLASELLSLRVATGRSRSASRISRRVADHGQMCTMLMARIASAPSIAHGVTLASRSIGGRTLLRPAASVQASIDARQKGRGPTVAK